MDVISTKRKLLFSEEDLHKLRQIVQRQKAEVATRERVSSSVLLANAEDKTAVAHPSMTFADTLPLTRKVAECSSPPAYRGFSSVIHISREGTYHSARSSAAQADLHTRSRKVAHPASARSAGMITASDWRLGNQLIQKFFGSKMEQSSISLAQSADHKSDRLVSPNSRSSPQKVDARVIEEEIRPDNPKGIDGGETALINSSIPDDGPRAVVGSTIHSLEEDDSNAAAPCLVGQKRPAGRSPYDQYHCNPPCDLVSIGSSFCLLATNSQDSARKQARSGQHQRSQRRQQQNNQEQAASTKTDRCAVVPVPDREALRALVRQQRKERHEKRQRDLEAAELSRARIAQNLQLTAQKAAAAANRRGRHGPPPHKASFGAWNDTVTSQPNENLPSMDAATRSSEFPAVTLQALGVSNSNADTVAESGCLRLLTASGDRVPSELARRASELLAEAEDSASVDDNGPHNGRGRKRSTLRGHTRPRKQTGGRALAADATNAVDRTVRGRRLPSPPHLNGPPPAPSAPRVANSLSPGGDPIQTQHDPQNVSCSSQPQSTPLGTFTHAGRDRPSDATNKNGAADSGGNSVGRSSIYLTKDARTVAELKQQRATETAAVSVAGTTARNVIGDDKINSLLSGDNVDHRKYLAALSARHHAHFSSRADPCTEEALCKARLSANRTRRLLSLSCAPREAVGEAAASDSDSPFTPSTDEETLGTLPGGDDDRWFCLEASSDEVGSADEEAAVVSDQLYSAAAATKPRHHPCYTSRPAVRVSGHSVGKKNGDVETTRNGDFQFEPDPLRFMSVYRQKCRLAAHAPDLTAHVSCKPHTEVSIEDTNMASEIATHRPSLRTLGDPTMNVNHTQLASITSTPLAGTILVKSSQNSTAISAISTSKSQSTLGAKNTRITRLPPAPTGPPRLTAAALGLSLTANVNRLDALAASIEQLQGMESLRQLSLAQAESVSLAQLIQFGQVKESFGINQPTCTHSRPSDLIPSNKNHRTVKEEDSGPVGLQTRKSAAVASSSRGSSQNESSAAVISTSISTHHTSNPSSSRILEISQTARTSSVQDSTLRTSSANGSVVLESTVGAVSEAVQSVAEISNSRLDLGISARTSLQTSVIFPETESKERNSQSTHHTFPKAFDRPFHADKSLNTTNDLLTAIEALDQPIGETSKPPTLAKVEKAVDVSEPGGQILRLNSEDYKGLYKMRAEELKRRKHKAQLVMLLSERLALQESEVVQLESKALQSLRRKLAEPPKLTPPLVGKGEVRTPVSRKRAAVSHKQRETLQGDSTEPEEEESVSGSAVVSSDRLKLPLSVDQGEEGTSVSVSVTVAAAAATASITTSTTASSLVSMSSAASVANDYATTARSSSRSGGSLPKVSARSATSANDTAVPSPRANILSARDLSLMTTVDATGQDTAGTARTMAPATYSTASFIEESSSDRPHGSRATTPRSASSTTLTPEHIIDLHSSTSARILTPGFEAGVVISARTLSPLPSGDKNSTGGVSEPPQPRPTGSGDELSADSLEPEVSTASGLSHRERRISAVGAGASEGDSSTAVATGSSASLRHRRHRREKESRLRARSEMEVGNGGDCEWRSQLYAMIDNLVKQERLLARLDRSGSGGNKHELKRLAKTLSKHRQMCTQIIERIHGDLIAHYSRESVITGDDGSYTSLSQRPFLDDPCTSNMVISPSALLAEVVVSTASRSSKRLSQPATVVAGSAVASPQRDHLVERVSTTASIVDVCPIPPASAEAELLSLSAGSHHSGEEQETAESPTSMLSEYSVSIDDQTPSVSRPQTTMSKMPSYRTSPEDLESKSESRLAATTTTHTTAPTPALVDAGVNTPSPRIDSSRHRVLELTTPLTSAANDQKEADIVSDTLYQGILEETPRDSVKLSTPPPSSRSTSTADLPVSEAEVLDRPPSSVSAQSALPPPNELRVSRPQSATGLSMRNDSQEGASSVTPAVSSPRIKSAGSELGSSNLSPAETLGSRSELASPRGHAAEDGVPIDLEAGKLSTTDKFSTKTETPEGTDDVATVLSTPSDHMLAYDTVSTKDQAPAASRIDMESPNSSESSRRSAEISAAEKGSKVASPAVFSPELQNHADTAVEKQPALFADAGAMSLAHATSTVDECNLLMAEEFDIDEVSLTDDDDESDSVCERILQLSFSPRAEFEGVSSPAVKAVVEGHHPPGAQPPLTPESPRSPPTPQATEAETATPSAQSPFSPPAGQLGNQVGNPVGPLARQASRSKENGSAQTRKSSLLDTLISPTPVVSEPKRQPKASSTTALHSPPTAALAEAGAVSVTADGEMGVGKSKRSSSPASPPPPASPGATNAATAVRIPDVVKDRSYHTMSEPTRLVLAAVATNLFNELLNNAVNAVLVQNAGRTNAAIKQSPNEQQKTSLSKQMGDEEETNQVNGELSPKHTVVLEPTDEFFRMINRENEEELSEESVTSASDEASSDAVSVGEPTAVGLPPEAVRGLIANTPDRIHSLVTCALQYFWSFRSTSDGGFEAALRNAQPPELFLAEYSDEEDVELAATGQPVTFVNRMLVFEYLRELLLRIYAGEDAERRSSVKPAITSSQFRLWKGLSRPTSLERLSSLVTSHLQSDLTLNLQQSLSPAPAAAAAASQFQRMPKLTQWTLNRKNWLDQLLELEMRADEATWINYTAYEEEIKQGLVTQVLDDLLETAVCTVFEAAKDLVGASSSSTANNNQRFSSDSSRSRNPSSVISVA